MTRPPTRPPHDRRTFLRAGALVGLQALLARGASGLPREDHRGAGYGPLFPERDETTGLPLIQLPRGFRYKTFGWTGDPLTAAAGATPASHDGMGVVQVHEHVATLVRNHELSNPGTPFGPAEIRYDNRGRGGTTKLTFDLQQGEWLTSDYGLGGTSRNCAGGVTPWGSWLTCEETLAAGMGFRRPHGFVFEVPAAEPAHPVALRSLGRFSHEAVAVDPRTGFVYLTEDDRYTSGFYRFRPRILHTLFGLEGGGVLEMLKVKGVDNADLMLVSAGETFPVEWIPIDAPAMRPQTGVGPYGSFDGQTTSASGPFFQGFEQGGAQFRRLEGALFDEAEGLCYFADTEGGLPVGATLVGGALWCYDPRREELRVVAASVPPASLLNPDNIALGPRGGILICEDNGMSSGTRMIGLSAAGELFPFARNDVVLAGEVNGIAGNFRSREWCGATFAGDWLFANIQTPGITFAITGPWGRGRL